MSRGPCPTVHIRRRRPGGPGPHCKLLESAPGYRETCCLYRESVIPEAPGTLELPQRTPRESTFGQRSSITPSACVFLHQTGMLAPLENPGQRCRPPRSPTENNCLCRTHAGRVGRSVIASPQPRDQARAETLCCCWLPKWPQG